MLSTKGSTTVSIHMALLNWSVEPGGQLNIAWSLVCTKQEFWFAAEVSVS